MTIRVINPGVILQSIETPKSKDVSRSFFNKLDFPDKKTLIDKRTINIQLKEQVSKNDLETNIDGYANFLRNEGFTDVSVDKNEKQIKIKTYKIKFIEYKPPQKNIPTRIMERGSVWIFNQSLKNKKKFSGSDEIINDEDTMIELRKIFKPWGEVPSSWIDSYYKQQKKLFEVIGKDGWEEIKYNEKDSFMVFIKDKVLRKIYNKRYSTWSPSDIWIIKENKKEDIKTILKDIANQKTKKEKDIALERLNDALSDLLVKKELIGVSLKKITGEPKFVFVNVRPQHMNFVKDLLDEDYEINERDITVKFDLFGSTEGYKEESRIEFKGNNSIQIKSNSGATSSSLNLNLKFESNIRSSGGRGGKIEVQLLKEQVKLFDNNFKNYSSNKENFQKKRNEYENYFKNIKTKSSFKSDVRDEKHFADEIEKMLDSKDRTITRIAQIKLMELRFLYEMYQVVNTPNNDLGEFWTEILYASLKKNRKGKNIFAPHGKLY